MSHSFRSLSKNPSPNDQAPEFLAVPDSVQPLMDTTPLEWLNDRIRSDRDGVLGKIMPGGFPAYARILHPLYSDDDAPIHWGEIATLNGKTAHPLMQLGRLLGFSDNYHFPEGLHQPRMGTLPDLIAPLLIETLREFTNTPELCYCCLWEGYSYITGGYPNVAKIALHDHSYLGFSGALEAILDFLDEGAAISGPNLWWPADESWLVFSDIDFIETYVGATETCIQQIIDNPEIEAYPSSLTNQIGFFSDTINT